MTKTVTLGGIFTVLVLIIVFGMNALPNGDVTDSKSAVKNAGENIATDTVVRAGGEAIKITGEQAIESACKNGPSQGCSTTVSSINLTAIAFAVVIGGIILAGIIGLAKFVMNVIESF